MLSVEEVKRMPIHPKLLFALSILRGVAYDKLSSAIEQYHPVEDQDGNINIVMVDGDKEEVIRVRPSQYLADYCDLNNFELPTNFTDMIAYHKSIEKFLDGGIIELKDADVVRAMTASTMACSSCMTHMRAEIHPYSAYTSEFGWSLLTLTGDADGRPLREPTNIPYVIARCLVNVANGKRWVRIYARSEEARLAMLAYLQLNDYINTGSWDGCKLDLSKVKTIRQGPYIDGKCRYITMDGKVGLITTDRESIDRAKLVLMGNLGYSTIHNRRGQVWLESDRRWMRRDYVVKDIFKQPQDRLKVVQVEYKVGRKTVKGFIHKADAVTTFSGIVKHFSHVNNKEEIYYGLA